MKQETLFKHIGAIDDCFVTEFAAEPEGKTRRFRWGPWGALAACAALALGAAVWGLGREAPAPISTASLPPASSVRPTQSASAAQGTAAPEEEMPEIRYSEVAVAADYALVPPESGTSREITEADILALLGGGEELPEALGWTGYELTGTVIFDGGGAVWLLSISGYRGPMEHFTLSLAAGTLPPTCVVYMDRAVTELWGVEVTGEKHDGEYGSFRRASFLSGDVGYMFEVTGEAEDRETVERMVSLLARQAILQGMALDAVSPEGAEPIFTGDPTFRVGEPNKE